MIIWFRIGGCVAVTTFRRIQVSRTSHPCVQFYYVVGGYDLSVGSVKRVLKANETSGDWILLPEAAESMNGGKSLDWIDFALQGGDERWKVALVSEDRRAEDVLESSTSPNDEEEPFAYIAKLDLDAFLHAQRLVVELTKIPAVHRRRLWYGGECLHELEGRFGMESFAPLGTTRTPKTFDGLAAFVKKICGEFYLVSADLADIASQGKNWNSENHRRGAYHALVPDAPVEKQRTRQFGEDSVMADMIKWGLEERVAEGALRGEGTTEELNVVSDWYRFTDHWRMREVRGDVSAQWVQPLGRHAEMLVIHQLKKENQWLDVMMWLNKTANGTSVCGSGGRRGRGRR